MFPPRSIARRVRSSRSKNSDRLAGPASGVSRLHSDDALRADKRQARHGSQLWTPASRRSPAARRTRTCAAPSNRSRTTPSPPPPSDLVFSGAFLCAVGEPRGGTPQRAFPTELRRHFEGNVVLARLHCGFE